MSTLRINRETRLCMSLSARPGNFGTRFQNHLYEELGLDFVYKAFSTTDIEGSVRGIRALGIRGCAVSMPFKESCIPFLDGLEKSAEAIGSVNTIVNDDGRLTGFNTDYIAVRKIASGIDPAVEFVLRGSGGMGKAVACALRDSGFRNGTVLARNEARGRALAEQCGYRWIGSFEGRPGMLVNVTPLGMEGGADAGVLAFDEAAIEAAWVVFDVVARPAETPLIARARALGKTVYTGSEVIVLQGLEQFVLYTGVRPDQAAVARAAAFALA